MIFKDLCCILNVDNYVEFNNAVFQKGHAIEIKEIEKLLEI